MKTNNFNIHKIIFIITMCLSVIIGSVSYAYFVGNSSNDNNQELVTNTARLALTYTDCATSVQSDCANISRQLSPGESVTKTFKVTNTGTLEASYYIKLSDINSTFVDNELVYSLSRLNNTSLLSNQVLPRSSSEEIIFEDTLGVGETKEYRLTILFKNIESGNSEINKGATFNLKIGILNKDYPSGVQTIKDMVKNYSDATTNVITLDAPSGGNCTNTLAYDGTNDNNLRYVGANPCNYVSFNNELWRVIGIFNGKLKIIRNEDIGSYSWDSSESSVNSGCGINQWGPSGSYEGADLMRELNGDYLDTTLTSNTLWYGSYGTQSLQFEYTKVIKSDAQNMIANSFWNTGSPTSISYESYASTLYEGERSNNTGKICSINSNYNGIYCNDTVVRNTGWVGKVGLIYPSDSVFATSGGTTTDRSTCLVTSTNTWGYNSVSDCRNNDWLRSQYGAGNYTLTPVMDDSFADEIALLTNQGTFNSTRTKEPAFVYPVVFLKNNVRITDGVGTEQNPYIVSLP